MRPTLLVRGPASDRRVGMGRAGSDRIGSFGAGRAAGAGCLRGALAFESLGFTFFAVAAALGAEREGVLPRRLAGAAFFDCAGRLFADEARLEALLSERFFAAMSGRPHSENAGLYIRCPAGEVSSRPGEAKRQASVAGQGRGNGGEGARMESGACQPGIRCSAVTVV